MISINLRWSYLAVIILFEVNDNSDISAKHMNLTRLTGAVYPCLPISGSTWSMIDSRMAEAGLLEISHRKFFPVAVVTSISKSRSVNELETELMC